MDEPEQLQFAEQIPEIFNDWETLLPKIEDNTFFDRPTDSQSLLSTIISGTP
jgi:hypothetical protein